jgi:hypothetical protein
MKKKLIMLLGIVGMGLTVNIGVGEAQVYDEEIGICKVHANYGYELSPETTPKHLALARIFISEGSFMSITDYVPIYTVLKNRSRGGRELTLENMMAYSPYSFNYHSDHFARYIPYLNEVGEEPLYWSERYPDRNWEDYRDQWFRALEIARRLVAGEVLPSACSGRVDHWGMNRQDMIDRALKNGNVLANCRGTKNLFWRIARR